MAVKSDLLEGISGIEHGFGAIAEPIPGFVPENIKSNWNARLPWKQVHGVGNVEVHASEQACGEVDALYSRKKLLPVAVVTGDCVPILMSRKDGKAVAAIHAGWRGTRARILRALWKDLVLQNEKPQDWVAAIGPAIGPCCYEVSDELALDFLNEFTDYAPQLVVPQKRILDLQAINRAELKSIGVGEVDVIRKCTFCLKDSAGAPLFHSYRREKGKTRQWSVIMQRDS